MLVRICHELLLLRLLLPGRRHLGLLVLSACGSERHHVGCRHLRGWVDGRAGWLFLEGCFGCGLLGGFGRCGAGLSILRLQLFDGFEDLDAVEADSDSQIFL